MLFAWRGFESSCCCSGVLEGVLVSSLMDSKGDVRHFFGVLFAWSGFESCCCSGVLEGASSNGFGIFFIPKVTFDVRHFFGALFAWRGFESCCCSGVLERASSNGFGIFSDGLQR